MRRLLFLTVTAGVTAITGIVACNSADFTPATPKDCRKVQCDCEEDPTQPTCVAIPGQPEGGFEGGNFDSSPPLDAADDTTPADAGDDAADASDAADQ